MKTTGSINKTFKILISILPVLLALTFLSFGSFNDSVNADQPKYSNVRIFAVNESDFKRLTEAGLFIDHAISKPGKYVETWLSEVEIELLKKSAVPYEILIDDWQKYYESKPKMNEQERSEQMQNAKETDNVSHSIYGSMGGYLTYAEVVAKLDSMRLEYPQFISTKFSIGNTFEGRTMWAVRVTKNPDAPTGRPEVFYNALIHAREPESMETQMYYFYWLFENYGTDPEATYILNNREIYWMPVFNADGYVYNQSTNPDGGGFWRCNRHGSGDCGWVDLNRNWGTYQFWNSTNGGSSEDSCSGGQSTYRGRAPFSEIETRNVMNFVNSRNFNSVFNAHTYGNYLLKPWDWIDPTPTPDDNKFNQFIGDMSAVTNYVGGSTSQTLGYMVRGGANDWFYNDSAHANHNIFGITPETGGDFWPAQSEIVPLAQIMLYSNKYMSMIAGAFVNPVAQKFNNENYTAGESGNLKIVFKNKGLEEAANTKIILTPVSGNLSIPVQQYSYPLLTSFAQDSSVFDFIIGSNVPANTALSALLTIKTDTSTIYSKKVYILVGPGNTVLSDNAESSFGNWTTNQGWALTTSQSNSPTHSFTDSPLGNYADDADNSMTLATAINIASAQSLFLSFNHKYATEPGYDFCNVEVSTGNNTWQKVRSYSGIQNLWTAHSIDLTSFAEGASQIKVRFRLSSDGFLNDDGWYVDDVKIISYNVGPVGIFENNNFAEAFSLSQNFPNPFNPNTIINYQLPMFSNVSLKVYDALGKEVSVLINESRQPGNYSVEFDGSNFASGIYYYKLIAGEFIAVRRMMLVK